MNKTLIAATVAGIVFLPSNTPALNGVRRYKPYRKAISYSKSL